MGCPASKEKVFKIDKESDSDSKGNSNNKKT